MRRVPGQQHPADPVALGLPGGAAEAGEPARRVHAEVGACDGPQPLPELLQRRRGRPVLRHPFGGYDEAVPSLPDGGGAEPQLGRADLRDGGGDRRRVLRSPPSRRAGSRPWRGSPGKPTPSRLRTRTASAVAAHEVARAQARAVGQFGGHPLLVLAQPDHFAAAADLGAEFDGTLLQEPLGDRLGMARPYG